MRHFLPITEQRYADYPRRYSNEYTIDGRTRDVEAFDFRSSCATLSGAKTAALRAAENYRIGIVRIFDRRLGQYVMTYKRTKDGIERHKGAVK